MADLTLVDTEVSNQVYECHNPQCPLGSRKDPGRFTGGITEAQLETIYGTTTEEERTAENVGWGEGHCPNCGQKGTPVTVDGEPLIHESLVGEDPNQDLHEEVHGLVLNKEINPEDAQEALETLVDEKTSNSEQP